MLSWKRLCYVILMVTVVSTVFMLYNINEERTKNIKTENDREIRQTFLPVRPLAKETKQTVRIFGNPQREIYGEIYQNVRQLFLDLHFSVEEEEQFLPEEVKTDDLVVFCEDSIGSHADLVALGKFVEQGGRVILAAGLAEGNEDSYIWPYLGIREKSVRENYNRLSFQKPLFPFQQEEMTYDGYSLSTWMTLGSDAEVYIEDAKKGVPILHTYEKGTGGMCLINGTFLSDARCLGLLTGAAGALLPDFIYPVMGIKTVFLDNFPMITYINDKACMKLYGCSTESFVRDVVWPNFQGISLRTDTPYTSGILTVASSEKSFPTVNDSLFTTIGKSALQYDGELIYTEKCLNPDKICFNQAFIDEFHSVFSNYEIRGLALQTEEFTEDMLQIPQAKIDMIRGMLHHKKLRLSCENGRYVYPAATTGNSMEEGNLFAISSVVAAYGMISHVFDVNALIAEDENTPSWDLDKKQIGIFEKQTLKAAPWLMGVTLSETKDYIKSYRNLDYRWSREGNQIVLDVSGAGEGQTFFCRTEDEIRSAEGLSYEEAGNGYYLLRVLEEHAVIEMEGE